MFRFLVEPRISIRKSPSVRQAFTLIEVLVVIAIIALLVGITVPAVQKIRGKAKVATARNEIAQLDVAIGTFKTTYNVTYIPSFLTLKNDYTVAGNLSDPDGSFAYLNRVWKLSPNNIGISVANQTLNGNQCLVFFLGGFPTPGLGFQDSMRTPFNTGGARKGASFEGFSSTRLTSNGEFKDPWGNPYFYLSSKNGNDYDFFNGGQCTILSATVSAYKDNGKYVNPNGYQIISAGEDAQPGPGGEWNTSIQAVDAKGRKYGVDDLANFNSGILGGAR